MVSQPDFTVRLERVFQGPMDLLLHLVREQEVEIHEVEIARVIDGYLSYLNSLQELDLEVAGDFLVMAATLMAIKSRSLLPAEELDLEDELDPKDELIQRLIEYRRFRNVADDLAARMDARSKEFGRGWHGEVRDNEPEREFDLGELTPFDLLAVYSRLMRETSSNRTHHVAADPRPLRFYVEEVVRQLKIAKNMGLSALIASIEDVPPREAVIGSFCALLELVRMQLVEIEQEDAVGEIAIRIREDESIEARLAESFLEEEAAPGQEEASTGGEPASPEAPGSDAAEPLDDGETAHSTADTGDTH